MSDGRNQLRMTIFICLHIFGAIYIHKLQIRIYNHTKIIEMFVEWIKNSIFSG